MEKKPAEPETPAHADTESHTSDADGDADFSAIEGDGPSDLNSDEFPDFLADGDADHSAPATETPRIKDLLGSPDIPSRMMTFLSLAFAFLAIVCMGLLITVYVKYRHSLPKAVAVVAPVKKEAIDQTFSESLGNFELFLKGERKQNDGHLDVDVVAECSTKEICAFLKEHTDEARDRVNPVLSNSARADLLNPETKASIRRRIADQLNLIPGILDKAEGRVTQVFFNNMKIEDDDSQK